MIRRPPRSTLFPYTTLFRSRVERRAVLVQHEKLGPAGDGHDQGDRLPLTAGQEVHVGLEPVLEAEADRPRSEEHTSELQSRQYLVCRLLLEKKNKHLSLLTP